MKCTKCGTEWNNILCSNCASKETPIGPPLKTIKRYGFERSYRFEQNVKLSTSHGAQLLESDPEFECVLMGKLFVGCDSKTYVSYRIVYEGTSYSWTESWPNKQYTMFLDESSNISN